MDHRLTGACGGSRSATGPPPPPFIGSRDLGAAILRARPASGPSLADAMLPLGTVCVQPPKELRARWLTAQGSRMTAVCAPEQLSSLAINLSLEEYSCEASWVSV